MTCQSDKLAFYESKEFDLEYAREAAHEQIGPCGFDPMEIVHVVGQPLSHTLQRETSETTTVAANAVQWRHYPKTG